MATNLPPNFDLVVEPKGFSDKADPTNLPPGVLIYPSHDVLITPGNRWGNRKGFTLDGQVDTNAAGIKSSFDWTRYLGEERNLKAGNGTLWVRYVASAGDKWDGNTFSEDEVYYIPILESLGDFVNFNFGDWWDNVNIMPVLLMVNGTADIKFWYGAFTTLLSATGATITKQGVETWAELGFPPAGDVLINGNTYAYTGGTTTTTITGVSPSPAAEPVQSVTVAGVGTTTNASMTDMDLVKNDLITVFQQQVYVADFANRRFQVSQVDDYTDYSVSAQRIVGEGAAWTLGSYPSLFVTQEDALYLSAGPDQWHRTQFEFLGDNGIQEFTVIPLKTTPQQGGKSQAATTKTLNDVLFLSHEPTISSLGRITGVVLTPQTSNISDPIKNLFDTYDFTDAALQYFQYFLYIAVPREGTVLVYNLDKKWWEAPQTLPVGRFAIIDGELYGHDANSPQTYKLFTGYNDNGAPIDSLAAFSFQQYGIRGHQKYFNQYYSEGYISGNATLTIGMQFETDGCATSLSKNLSGTDPQVCLPLGEGDLGKESTGKWNLGAGVIPLSSGGLPPKFRIIETFLKKPFYEVSYFFGSVGADFNWELLAFGGLVERSGSYNIQIKN